MGEAGSGRGTSEGTWSKKGVTILMILSLVEMIHGNEYEHDCVQGFLYIELRYEILRVL